MIVTEVQPGDMQLASYRFDLPTAQIAQTPPDVRGASRLMCVPLAGGSDCGTVRHAMFADLPELLQRHFPKGVLLVANNSRVLQARLLGRRHTGGKVEFLLLTPLPLLVQTAVAANGAGNMDCTAEAEGLLRCGARVHEGDVFHFGDVGTQGELSITILEQGNFGHKKVRLAWQGGPEALTAIFGAIGHIPLPPYIRREDAALDQTRYQTIYARADKNGSVAAPTAGLHFTPAIREELAAAGADWAEVTLYVGYGTFSPVRCDDIREHHMHREYIEIPEATAQAVIRARAQGKAVIAVGTTSCRTLEGAYAQCGEVRAFQGWTDIFFYPGRPFHVIDGLLTNFHLPESSLLMLVAALVGRERLLAAYGEAVREGYRFFSYGDAILLADADF